jgi:hypothetical protein
MKTKDQNKSESAIITFDLQKRLEEELEWLKRTLKLEYELKVLWIPNSHPKLSGEVKKDFIYIYVKDEELALETLKHEFIDCAISRVIEPYKEVTNKLISFINEQAYHEKEKLVEALSALITSTN